MQDEVQPLPARRPVTRERAIVSAVALADRDGLDAVSMRRLAAELDVVPMALYKHVASKDDLVGGMVDAVIAEYEPPLPDLPWRTAARRRILSAREAILRHPWARRAIESRTTRTDAVLDYMDSLAGTFIGGGLSPDLTHFGMHALGHRIWGFSPEAFEDPGALALPESPAEQQAMLAAVTARYPNIVAIALDGAGGELEAVGSSCDEQVEFEFTLELMLDSFERLHAAGWSSRRR